VLDLLQPPLQAAGVAIDVSALDGSAVTADPVALEQVLHNLVHNALQALEAVPAGQRRLAFSADTDSRGGPGGRATLQVHDSGPGFTPEALEQALEPFFTTRAGSQGHGQGLGLGLSLCDTLAAGMGGTLRVANHERGGALVTLTLPAA
jgi:C4-dicarboxylate-specific signal transduction histidine kinase